MTGADIAASATRKAVIPQASGSDRAFSRFFRALMYGAIGVSLLALNALSIRLVNRYRQVYE